MSVETNTLTISHGGGRCVFHMGDKAFVMEKPETVVFILKTLLKALAAMPDAEVPLCEFALECVEAGLASASSELSRQLLLQCAELLQLLPV